MLQAFKPKFPLRTEVRCCTVLITVLLPRENFVDVLSRAPLCFYVFVVLNANGWWLTVMFMLYFYTQNPFWPHEKQIIVYLFRDNFHVPSCLTSLQTLRHWFVVKGGKKQSVRSKKENCCALIISTYHHASAKAVD